MISYFGYKPVYFGESGITIYRNYGQFDPVTHVLYTERKKPAPGKDIKIYEKTGNVKV